MQSLYVLVGLDWAKPMMYLLCMSHVHAFSMHLYVFSHILLIVNCFGTFLIVFFSLPLLLVTLVVSIAPKRKYTPARNPLHSGASSSSNHAPLSLSDSVMMMPTRHLRKTFLDEAFIQNAESSWVILLTPTFPLSFTVGNGSLFVTSPSLVLSC